MGLRFRSPFLKWKTQNGNDEKPATDNRSITEWKEKFKFEIIITSDVLVHPNTRPPTPHLIEFIYIWCFSNEFVWRKSNRLNGASLCGSDLRLLQATCRQRKKKRRRISILFLRATHICLFMFLHLISHFFIAVHYACCRFSYKKLSGGFTSQFNASRRNSTDSASHLLWWQRRWLRFVRTVIIILIIVLYLWYDVLYLMACHSMKWIWIPCNLVVVYFAYCALNLSGAAKKELRESSVKDIEAHRDKKKQLSQQFRQYFRDIRLRLIDVPGTIVALFGAYLNSLDWLMLDRIKRSF